MSVDSTHLGTMLPSVDSTLVELSLLPAFDPSRPEEEIWSPNRLKPCACCKNYLLNISVQWQLRIPLNKLIRFLLEMHDLINFNSKKGQNWELIEQLASWKAFSQSELTVYRDRYIYYRKIDFLLMYSLAHSLNKSFTLTPKKSFVIAKSILQYVKISHVFFFIYCLRCRTKIFT